MKRNDFPLLLGFGALGRAALTAIPEDDLIERIAVWQTGLDALTAFPSRPVILIIDLEDAGALAFLEEIKDNARVDRGLLIVIARVPGRNALVTARRHAQRSGNLLNSVALVIPFAVDAVGGDLASRVAGTTATLMVEALVGAAVRGGRVALAEALGVVVVEGGRVLSAAEQPIDLSSPERSAERLMRNPALFEPVRRHAREAALVLHLPSTSAADTQRRFQEAVRRLDPDLAGLSARLDIGGATVSATATLIMATPLPLAVLLEAAFDGETSRPASATDLVTPSQPLISPSFAAFARRRASAIWTTATRLVRRPRNRLRLAVMLAGMLALIAGGTDCLAGYQAARAYRASPGSNNPEVYFGSLRPGAIVYRAVVLRPERYPGYDEALDDRLFRGVSAGGPLLINRYFLRNRYLSKGPLYLLMTATTAAPLVGELGDEVAKLVIDLNLDTLLKLAPDFRNRSAEAAYSDAAEQPVLATDPNWIIDEIREAIGEGDALSAADEGADDASTYASYGEVDAHETQRKLGIEDIFEAVALAGSNEPIDRWILATVQQATSRREGTGDQVVARLLQLAPHIDLAQSRLPPARLAAIVGHLEPEVLRTDTPLARSFVWLIEHRPEVGFVLQRSASEAFTAALANRSLARTPLASSIAGLMTSDATTVKRIVDDLPAALQFTGSDADTAPGTGSRSPDRLTSDLLVRIAASARTTMSLRIAALTSLASIDPKAAERLYAMPQSALPAIDRRDLIAILANAGSSVISVKEVELTFKGASRPLVRVEDVKPSEQMEAVRVYTALSGRAYSGNPKMIPPMRPIGAPGKDDAGQWLAIAATYPWFPGADDALYRGLFSLLRERRFEEVWTSFSRADVEIGDRDATPLSVIVVRLAAMEAARQGTESAFAQMGESATIVGRALIDASISEEDCRVAGRRLAPLRTAGGAVADAEEMCRAARYVRTLVADGRLDDDHLIEVMAILDREGLGWHLNAFGDYGYVAGSTGPADLAMMIDTGCTALLPRFDQAAVPGLPVSHMTQRYLDMLTAHAGRCRPGPSNWKPGDNDRDDA